MRALSTFPWLSTPRLPGQMSEVTVVSPNRPLSEGFHSPAGYTQISGHGMRGEACGSKCATSTQFQEHRGLTEAVGWGRTVTGEGKEKPARVRARGAGRADRGGAAAGHYLQWAPLSANLCHPEEDFK